MMDLQAPNGQIANRRTAPLAYSDFPIPFAMGLVADRYPTASICPTPVPEGDSTYRIYYHLEAAPPTLN